MSSRAARYALAFVASLACEASPAKGPPLASVTTSPLAREPDVATASPLAPNVRYPLKLVEADRDADALSLIRTRRLEAKAEGRVLVVYVGAKWCVPCKRFRAEIDSGRLDARLERVTLLAFDADADGDRMAAAGYTYAFVPFVALPGPDGRPREAEQAKGKGSEAWREILGRLEAWQASAP